MGLLWGVLAGLSLYFGVRAVGMVSDNVRSERWAVPLAVAAVATLFVVGFRAGARWMVTVSDVVLAFLLLYALWTARMAPRVNRASARRLAERLHEYTSSTHALHLLLVVQDACLCVLPGERRLAGPFRYALPDSGCPHCFIEDQVRALADGWGIVRYRSLLAGDRAVEMHFVRPHGRAPWRAECRVRWPRRWERPRAAPACADHAALTGGA